jgi:hypothetical protein
MHVLLLADGSWELAIKALIYAFLCVMNNYSAGRKTSNP